MRVGISLRIMSLVLPNAVFDWTPGADPKTAAELETFFYSPEVQALKERICGIGERIWNKGYVDGNGDVVAEVAEACRVVGIRLGIYLSPWDRHEPSYGDSPRYNEYFRNQLERSQQAGC